MRSALDWLTPGQRNRVQSEERVFEDQASPEDGEAEASANQEEVADQGIEPRQDLRQDLFGADSKYGRHGKNEEVSFSSSSSRSKTLPKVDYTKLVMLSLSNFSEYRESIKVVGYARGWPLRYRQPNLAHLQQRWNGVDGLSADDEIRREAFLVLYQTIPRSLKYLVDNVRSGDVMALWQVLYDRFLFVTASSIKKMKQEWESLYQGTTKLDEFISLISTKAKAMEMVGINVSDQDKATALIHGLSKDFEWLKNYYATREQYSFAEVATESLKFAVDRKWLADKEKSKIQGSSDSDSSKSKLACLDFNKSGCTRKNCRFKHEVLSKKKLQELETKVKTKRSGNSIDKDKKSVLVVKPKDKKCFTCGDPNHLSPSCPFKSKMDEYAKKLRNGVMGCPTGTLNLPVFMVRDVLSSEWILDSGAAHHITNSFDVLEDACEVPNSSVVFTVGNDHVMCPTHVGCVKLGGVKVSNVYFCKECPVNIVSESRLMLCGVDINKSAATGVAVGAYQGDAVLEAKLKDGLFVVSQVRNSSNVLSPL